MPLFKGLSSKSTPDKAIRYITQEDKAKYVSVRNLFVDEDYSKQFAETMNRFGKGKKFDERKYYHFKLSPSRKDKVDSYIEQLYAEALTEKLFPDCECVIATHTDTQAVHSHIIVNAVNPITGKKLRITESDYTKMKDEANRIGAKFGLSKLDFRKTSENKRTAEETHIMLKGGTSWKEDLREVIEEAKMSSSTQDEFISHLKLYGVTVTRSKTEYSFLHPEKQKPIRGKRLGENYSKEKIDYAIKENGYGRNANTTLAVAGDERGKTKGIEHVAAPRSVGDIQREMQRINSEAECARRGVDGERERIKAAERRLAEENKNANLRNGVGDSADKIGSKRTSKHSDFALDR